MHGARGEGSDDGANVLPKCERSDSVKSTMATKRTAKRTEEKSEETEPRNRRKDPEDLVRDPYMIDERERISVRLRKTYLDALHEHRGEKSFSSALHQALEAGLVELGWMKKPKAS